MHLGCATPFVQQPYWSMGHLPVRAGASTLPVRAGASTFSCHPPVPQIRAAVPCGSGQRLPPCIIEIAETCGAQGRICARPVGG